MYPIPFLQFSLEPTLIRCLSYLYQNCSCQTHRWPPYYKFQWSVLSPHCIWPISNIQHSWSLFPPWNTFGFQDTTSSLFSPTSWITPFHYPLLVPLLFSKPLMFEGFRLSLWSSSLLHIYSLPWWWHPSLIALYTIYILMTLIKLFSSAQTSFTTPESYIQLTIQISTWIV